MTEDKKTDLSEYTFENIPDTDNMSVGIVVSEWNPEVTEKLKEAAVLTLLRQGVPESNINVEYVPGSFELPLAAQWMLEHLDVDAVMCLGCVIQGETRHFEFICNTVSGAISNIGLNYARPVIFGVLTTDNMQQALERAGGTHGNKGVEAAVAAMKMINLSRKISGN